MKTLWVETLTLSSVLRLVGVHCRQPIAKILYLRGTIAGIALARFMRQASLLPQQLDPIVYSLGDLHVSDGRALRHVLENDISQLLNDYMPRLVQGVERPDYLQRFPPNKVFLYLYKVLAEDIYPPTLLAYLATCLGSMEEDIPHCLIQDRWLAGLIEKRSPGLCRWVDASLPPFLERLFQRATQARRVMASVFFVLVNTLRIVLPGSMRRDATSLPTVLVEYNGGVHPRYLNDVFWLPESGIDPQAVLLYCNGRQSVPDRSDLAEMKRLGLRWVSLPGFSPRKIVSALLACRVFPRILWRGFVRIVSRLRLAVGLLAEGAPEQSWLGAQVLRLMEYVEWWEAFLRQNHVFIHIHTQDTGALMVAQSIANDLTDSISIGYQWSWSHLTMIGPTQAQDQTVFFAWGPYFESLLMQSPSQVSRIFFCGHLSCRQEAPSAERAGQMRHELQKKGAQYILAIFDSSFDETGQRGHHSRMTCLKLYQALLAMAEHDSSLGLVIKPKCADNLLRLPEIQGAIEALVHKGRCRVLDCRVMAGEAALASDLLVGLSLNSAVIEGALLASKPGLHCDLSRNYDDPLCLWGYGRIVFHDIPSVLKAIELHRQGTSPSLGDHAPLLPKIDPFQDGAGAKRLGGYLRWYYDARMEGRTREAALLSAGGRYEEHWGAYSMVPEAQGLFT